MMLETPIFEPKKKKMINIFFNLFGVYYYNTYLCNRFQEARAFSSAGSEHLPYKQRVGGSNPSTPTKEEVTLSCLFFCIMPSRV